MGDQAVNAMVKGYVSNPNFGKKENENITCWNLLQLANEAAKSAYIDRWLERNQNCTDFALGIQRAIEGNDTEGYSWFLNWQLTLLFKREVHIIKVYSSNQDSVYLPFFILSDYQPLIFYHYV